MNNEDIKILLDKYKEGTATEAELALLESWYLSYQEPSSLEFSINERVETVDKVWANLQGKKTVLWPRFMAAAVIIITVSAGLYFGFVYRDSNIRGNNDLTKNDIRPGTNKAQLTFANGKVIDLSSSKSGVVINTDKLAYNDGTEVLSKGTGTYNSATEMSLNTPKGGTYKLVLPDGSAVWLNAASTLKFPASFAGLKSRKVYLSGEAYFEVKHDARRPFRVETSGQLIEDLGTAFNVNAYQDELTVKTTLVEGSIKIGKLVLKPGEQASGSGDKIQINEANLEESIGWKNGYFVFQNEPIGSIMRKISRWYNVEVVYAGEMPDDDFGGRVTRTANVSQILNKLELTNKVHFKIQGRRITVTK